jgi:hypothetical protein
MGALLSTPALALTLAHTYTHTHALRRAINKLYPVLFKHRKAPT